MKSAKLCIEWEAFTGIEGMCFAGEGSQGTVGELK